MVVVVPPILGHLAWDIEEVAQLLPIPSLLPRTMHLGGDRSSGHSVPPVQGMLGVSSEATPTMLAPFRTQEEEEGEEEV